MNASVRLALAALFWIATAPAWAQAHDRVIDLGEPEGSLGVEQDRNMQAEGWRESGGVERFANAGDQVANPQDEPVETDPAARTPGSDEFSATGGGIENFKGLDQ